MTGISGEYSGVNLMHVGYHYDAGLTDEQLGLAIGLPVGFVGLIMLICCAYCIIRRMRENAKKEELEKT